jgi:Protein of Unknown function (DUF2784)
MAAFLAGVIVAVHFAALLYIGFGGFLGWRWPKSLFIHMFFAAWGVAINTIPGLPCPLTSAEDYFRHQQGLGSLPGGFNEYYIYDDLLPRGLLPVVAVVAVIIFLVSYVGAFLLWRRRRVLVGSH